MVTDWLQALELNGEPVLEDTTDYVALLKKLIDKDNPIRNKVKFEHKRIENQ